MIPTPGEPERTPDTAPAVLAARSRPLAVGDPAPWFHAPTRTNPRFVFDTVAGRHVLLCFPGPLDGQGQRLVGAFLAHARGFDDRRLSFFGVLSGTHGPQVDLPPDRIPGARFFLDPDDAVSALYGALRPAGSRLRIAYLLDPALRVAAVFDLSDASDAGLLALQAALDRLPPPELPRPAAAQAPVLVVPDVFEPALCSRLVAYYDQTGGVDSGFMREVDGRTIGMIDHGHKRRRDCLIEDDTLKRACMARVHARLLPQIERAFQFRATRMERYIVSCYDAAERGRFRAHRDNTTRGTAHRRFAVSLFLNDGFEGGQLVFPEFGGSLFRAPPGSAIVFACSMLHEALPVISGRRYMFLPFLYDEAGRQQRTANLQYLAEDAGGTAPVSPGDGALGD